MIFLFASVNTSLAHPQECGLSVHASKLCEGRSRRSFRNPDRFCGSQHRVCIRKHASPAGSNLTGPESCTASSPRRAPEESIPLESGRAARAYRARVTSPGWWQPSRGSPEQRNPAGRDGPPGGNQQLTKAILTYERTTKR